MIQQEDEVDQFQRLEEKIESLIRYAGSVKHEKEELAERNRVQEEKITALSGELERLRLGRDKAKQKVVTLLERLENLGV